VVVEINRALVALRAESCLQVSVPDSSSPGQVVGGGGVWAVDGLDGWTNWVVQLLCC
jgi:hypothetical protein